MLNAAVAFWETWKTPIQCVGFVAIISWLYLRFQKTHLIRFVRVMIVLFVLYVAARMTGLQLLGHFMEGIIQLVMIGFIILFQPELRRLLVQVGQTEPATKNISYSGNEAGIDQALLRHELLETVRILSKTKTGALIVLSREQPSSENYLEAGTPIDALVSTELLLTIFHNNTPLHDGAVIISPEGRLVAAGVLLPLSENPKLGWQYGTRHRAAVGLTEMSPTCSCLVVSEENGRVSWAEDGVLEKLSDFEALQEHLNILYPHDGLYGDRQPSAQNAGNSFTVGGLRRMLGTPIFKGGTST